MSVVRSIQLTTNDLDGETALSKLLAAQNALFPPHKHIIDDTEGLQAALERLDAKIKALKDYMLAQTQSQQELLSKIE